MSHIHIAFIIESHKTVKQENRKGHKYSSQHPSFHINLCTKPHILHNISLVHRSTDINLCTDLIISPQT